MTLTVDGRRDEISQYAPETGLEWGKSHWSSIVSDGIRYPHSEWISHSFAYVGGTPKDRSYSAAVSRTPFRGCLKTVSCHNFVCLIE